MSRLFKALAVLLALLAAVVSAADSENPHKGCPFLEKGTKDATGCPVFGEGCPFKKHECPFKDKSHEDIVALINKCPHLKDQLAKCPKYNPEKEGCPFSKDGKMDVESCPFMKGKMKREADPMAKYTGGCPYLDKSHHVPGCPAFKEGCPFKKHECPFKGMTHEEAAVMMQKCPHLKEHLAKCPKYRPEQKEGCPFEHDGKMDVSKCPHFKHHLDAHDKKADPMAKYKGGCPYLDKQHHVPGCPAFKEGCPFREHECPFKDMSHEEAVAMMHKCPHLKEHLEKCPKYNKDQKEGCPFEHDGKMDVSKCPHFKHHLEAHEGQAKEGAKEGGCPFAKKGSDAQAGGCPFAKAKAKREAEEPVAECGCARARREAAEKAAAEKAKAEAGECPCMKARREAEEKAKAEAEDCPCKKAGKPCSGECAQAKAERGAEAEDCPCKNAGKPCSGERAQAKAKREAEAEDCPCKKAGKPCSGECAQAKAKREAENAARVKDEL